jgi:Uma2 family endonuclease
LKAPATLADWLALPGEPRVELIGGALIERELTGPRHGRVMARLGSEVTRRFDRKPGGRWPGGWWIVVDVAVRFEDEVYLPDLAGWRRDRCPTFPAERPVVARPDWVCEILSPSNARTDRVEKLRTYHRCQVPHYWLIDPEEQTLTVLRYGPSGYVVALTASADETVSTEPFPEMAFALRTLFPDEPVDDD